MLLRRKEVAPTLSKSETIRWSSSSFPSSIWVTGHLPKLSCRDVLIEIEEDLLADLEDKGLKAKEVKKNRWREGGKQVDTPPSFS